MPKKKIGFTEVLQPSDAIAFASIGIGLVIALISSGDTLAVRLIGICIAILGGVALFMTVSPRLTDLQIITPVRPSATTDLSSRTVQDAQKKSQTFDPEAYRESFGVNESEAPFIDENQTLLFDESPKSVTARQRESLSDQNLPAVGTEFRAESESSVRIVGVKKPTRNASAEPPKLISQMRQEARAKGLAEPPPEPSIQIVTGPITEEIHLSDEVVIRPVRRTEEPVPAVPEEQQVPAFVGEVIQVIEVVDADDVVEEMHEALADDAPVYEEAPALPAQQPTTTRRSPSVSLSTFVHEADENDDMSPQDPRHEFDSLLQHVLMVIRSATNARTAAFLWVNHDRQQLVVEAKITEAEHEFTSDRKIPMGRDALSQIAREGRPEIITQISPSAELELLPYYQRSAGTVSFIGVPVYYAGNVVGILIADSLLEDAYSDITVGFFGQFTKLISGLVLSYTSKYDLYNSSKTLEALQSFRALVGTNTADLHHVIKALFSTLIGQMEISRIGVVSFDQEKRCWALTDARSALDDGYRSNVGAPINLNASAAGEAIRSAAPVVHVDDGATIRVFEGEPPLDGGQFVAVPLATTSESFGSVVIENLESSLSQQDISLAEALGSHVASYFEHFQQAALLKHAALLDNNTGVLNDQGFAMRVREEFARAVDYNVPLTVCIVRLDASRTTQEQREFAILHVLKLVKEQLREYDVVSRVGPDTLGLALVGYKLQEAQNWTETMRRGVASSPVEIDGKRLSFTVSIGIAQAEPRDQWDDLIAHAEAALGISVKTGNKVTVFA